MDQTKPHFSCPACGRKLPWTSASAGRKGKCKCGQVVTVPAEPVAGITAEAMAEDVGEGVVPEPAAAGCPACGQAMEPEAVLCLNCGYNMRTGGQIATEVAPATERAVKTTTAGATAGARSKRAGSATEMNYPG